MSPEENKARSRRNWVIAGGLFAFVIVVFLVSIFRLGGDVFNRPL